MTTRDDVKQFERRHFELNNPLAAGLFRNQEELDEDKKLLHYARNEVKDAKSWAKSNRRSAVIFHDKQKNHITFRPLDAYKKLDPEVKQNHRVLKVIHHEASTAKLQKYLGNAVQNYGDNRVSRAMSSDQQKASGTAIKRFVGIDRAVAKIRGKGIRVKATENKEIKTEMRKIVGSSPLARSLNESQILGENTRHCEDVRGDKWSIHKN
jgi:hypothetical protein